MHTTPHTPSVELFQQPFLSTGSLLGLVVFCVTLLVYCILLVKHKKQCLRFRDWVLIPLTAIGGFVLYFIGYIDEGSRSLVTLSLRAFMSTFEMFLLHSDLIEVRHAMHASPLYMTCFAIVHFSAFLITFMIVIQLFGKHFLSWLTLRFSNARESHIFFTLNEPSTTLAKSLLQTNRKDRQVILLNKRTKLPTGHDSHHSPATLITHKNALLEQISKLDVLLLNNEYNQSNRLCDIGLRKTFRQGRPHLYFLSSDIDYNLRSALRATDELRAMSSSRASVALYVRANADYMTDIFERRKTPNIEIHTINPDKLAAVELVVNHPPVRYVAPNTRLAVATKDFSVLVVGFGNVGRYVLRSLVEHGQFVGSRFQASVIDREMESRQGEFAYRFPGMRHYDIAYHQAAVDSLAFWNLFDQKIDSLDYVVVSLGDSDLNIRTAINLCRYAKRKTDRPIDIFAKVSDNGDYDYLKTAAQEFDSIHIFGGNETVFTEEIIVNESRSLVAREIHDYYNQRKAPEKRIAWADLSAVKRLTNVSAALHVATKLTLAGLTVDDIAACRDEADFLRLLGTERLKNLAQGEHLHWNATLFANEWDTWHPAPGSPSNKDEQRKLHACLVDWDELEAVEKQFDEPYRQYDYDSIRNIYALVRNNLYR